MNTLATTGLQTHIWNNQWKSVAILFLFPLLLLVMLGAFFGFTGAEQFGGDILAAAEAGLLQYGHWAAIGTAIWFTIAWFFHGSMIRAATGAQSLTRKEAPELYNMLENLCISRGMAMPKLQMIDSPMLNAFASGISQKTYCITVTRGIVEALERDELEAVLAHELSHIRHKDVRLLITAVIFVGIISFLCEMIYRSLLYGGRGSYRRRDGKGGGGAVLIALAILVVGYVLAMLLRFALSRRREYLADAGAVELTKNPDAMIRALQKISGHADIPGMPPDIKQMCVENAHGFLGGMFATHPPIEDRIAALVALGGRMENIHISQGPWSGNQESGSGPWG